MKTICLMLALLSATLFAAEKTDEKPARVFDPPLKEFRLSNGTVFRNVTLVRYEKEKVVLKTSAGVTSLAYSYFPEPMRSRMIAERDGIVVAEKHAKATAMAQPRQVVGQVFITTRGAGAYKFAGANVIAYPMSVYDTALSMQRACAQETKAWVAWEKALASFTRAASAVTDADGFYELTLPSSSPHFIICHASRLVARSSGKSAWNEAEHSFWVVPADAARIDLNAQNRVP